MTWGFMFLTSLLTFNYCQAFSPLPPSKTKPPSVLYRSTVNLCATKKKTSKNAGSAKKPRAKSGGFGTPSVSIPVDPGWSRLRTWLGERGATLNGLEVGIVNSEIDLRGVVATRSFEKGEELFSIPMDSCTFSEARADASPIGAVYGTKDVPAAVRVALLLLWLAYAEPEEWAPALDVLPTRADFDAGGGGPLELWSPTEVDACGCPLLSAQVAARKAELRTLYEDVLAPGWGSALAGGLLQGMPLPSFEAVQLSAVVVASRAYGESTLGRTSILVPGVDMCNHQVASKVNTVKALAPWGAFVVVASKQIVPGDEIFISYGNMPNRQLLAQFGFMLPGAGQNALERATVPLGRLLAEPHAEGLEEMCVRGLLARGAREGQCSPWQVAGPELQEAAGLLSGGPGCYEELLACALATVDKPTLDLTLEPEPSTSEGTGRKGVAAAYRQNQRELLVGEIARVSSRSRST